MIQNSPLVLARQPVFASIKNLFNSGPALLASDPDGNNVPAYPKTKRNLFEYPGRRPNFGKQENQIRRRL